MKSKFLILIAALLSLSTASFAQTSARDADIDAKLNAGVLAGIAPPTGSQAVSSASSSASQRFIDPYLPAAIQSGKVILGQTDSKARVYVVKGDAKLVKKGSPLEKKLKKGDILEVGDKVYTESGSSVSITFDESYKNAVHIPENTKAVFDGIEPTNIRIENGSVFSAVDGLPQGSTWKVTTPTTVAAVRGTLYLVRFQALDGKFYAATVNVPNDGKNSAIDIHQISGEGHANVPEGKEITLQQGQEPSDSVVEDLDPEALKEILAFFENLTQLRDENDSNAPATSGQYSGPGNLDAAGPGVIGGDDTPLDVQEDTNSINNPPPSPEPTILSEPTEPFQEMPPIDEDDDNENNSHRHHHNDHHHNDHHHHNDD